MQNIIDYFLSLGSTVFVPIVLILIGIVLRQGFLKSIKSGITVGVGFIGLNLAISLITSTLEPAVNLIVERFGFTLTVIDVGSGAAGAIAFGSVVGATIIPAVFLLNIILLAVGLTKTMNIDIFNYGHYAFTGAIVHLITGNYWLGLGTALLQATWSLMSADYSAKQVQTELGVEAISIPQGYGASTVPFFTLLDKIFDKIPFLRDSNLELSDLQAKIGMFADPVIVAAILGVVLSLMAGYNFQEASNLIMGVSAIMVLFPRMVKIIVEGLIPISEAAKEFFNKKFNGREVFIGLDSAITLGHPVTQMVGTLLIPITLVLAVILPGNRVLPLADLAFAAFFICMATIVYKGNILKTLIGGILNMIVTLYIATWATPYVTQLAQGSLDISGEVSSLWNGNQFAFIAAQIGRFGPIVLLVGFAVTILGMFKLKSYLEKQDAE